MKEPTARADPAVPTGRPDLRLVPPAAAAWLAATVTTGLSARVGALLAALLVATALAAAAARSRGRWLIVGALVCAAASSGGAAARVHAVTSTPIADLAAQEAAARATIVVTADAVPSTSIRFGRTTTTYVVRARLTSLTARGRTLGTRLPILVLSDDVSWSRFLPGQEVRASGRLAPRRSGQDVVAVLRTRGPPEPVGRAAAVQRAAGTLRAGLRAAVAPLPADERGLLPVLVLGDTSALPDDLAQDFRTAGLTHLTAVSGANCAIVLAFVLLLARSVGLRGRWLPAVGTVALLGFLVLARPQPSVLRATAMGLVAVAALASGRRRLGIPALSAATLVLVLADPWLARSYGFVLSVLATAALLVIAPGWATALGRHVPRPLAAAVAVPAAAQLVCAPVLVLLSGQVSLVAVPANLLVAPAVAPATVLGIAAAVTSPVCPPLAGLLARLAGVPTWVIVTVARRSAALPAAAIGWPGGFAGAVALAVLTVAAVLLQSRVRGLAALLRPGTLAAAALAGLLAAGLPRLLICPGWPPPGWLIVACDVGQGDALAVRTGDGVLVVDSGPDPGHVDRCLRDLGVHAVATVVLSHFDADHVDGLPGVLRGRRVGEIVTSPLPQPPFGAAHVHAWAAAAGVPVRLAAVGERHPSPGSSWTVVAADGHASDPNDSSVVLLVETGGVRMLLTGDIGPEAQRAVLRALDPDGDRQVTGGAIDVLKVPHHGSARQEPDLFRTARARIALVSVGADNDYGHPADVALRLAAEDGAVVGRTDTDGDLAVVGTSGALRLVRRGG